MILGLHGLLYGSDAQAPRTFIREFVKRKKVRTSKKELRTEIETTVQVTFGPGTAARAVARFLAWPS